MSQQLDAIVDATETATNGSLKNPEGIDEAVDKLRESGAALEVCDAVSNRTMAAMENCTFQDIIRRRVTKVVRSMKFVEERVNSMVERRSKSSPWISHKRKKLKTRSASKDRKWRAPRSSKMLSTPYSTCFSERPASSFAFRDIAQHVFGQQILDVL